MLSVANISNVVSIIYDLRSARFYLLGRLLAPNDYIQCGISVKSTHVSAINDYLACDFSAIAERLMMEPGCCLQVCDFVESASISAIDAANDFIFVHEKMLPCTQQGVYMGPGVYIRETSQFREKSFEVINPKDINPHCFAVGGEPIATFFGEDGFKCIVCHSCSRNKYEVISLYEYITIGVAETEYAARIIAAAYCSATPVYELVGLDNKALYKEVVYVPDFF